MGQGEGKERRARPRVTIVEDLYFDAKATRPLVDLSEDGMFIATNEPYLQGSVLELRFRLFRDDREIRAKAEVLYVQEGTGMGLRFVEIPDQDRERIRRFIARFCD